MQYAPEYNTWPRKRVHPKTEPPLTRPEEQLRRDLRALETVQASRPRKPPGKP